MAEKVLPVDDEREFLDVLAERMHQRGMKVVTADSPRTVLRDCAIEEFDAIVLDMVMPDMDGLELLSKLMAQNPDLQVILLTGYGTVEKGVRAMKLGAMDFLEKPVDLQILCEKIREARQHKLLLVERDYEEDNKKILASVCP